MNILLINDSLIMNNFNDIFNFIILLDECSCDVDIELHSQRELVYY